MGLSWYGAHLHGSKTRKMYLLVTLVLLGKPMLIWNRLFKQLHASLTLPTKYLVILLNCFWSHWYDTPLVLNGVLLSPWAPFQQVDDEKLTKNWCIIDQLQLLAVILTQWWCPVTSIEALDLLYWAMCAVRYWRTAMAIEMTSKNGVFFVCDPVGRRGNTVQILAQ